MSCTMTMDIPESAISFVMQKKGAARREMSALFMAFLSERMGYVPEERENPFSSFCGSWDEARFQEFESATKRQINVADWQ